MIKKGKLISCILALTLTTSMGSAIPAFAVVAPQVSQIVSSSHRLAGINRYATADIVSQKGWKTSDTVVLASGEDYADALTSGPLAKKYNAPILLTSKASISAGTISEIGRLKAKNIIIIGGVGAISPGVATQLTNSGFSNITRIGGINRYETSTMVAAKLDKPNAVVIVPGQNFPDALSISSIASNLGLPIILSSKDGLSDNAKSYISNNGIAKSYIVGGVGVLAPTIEKQVTNPIRLSGANRYETNLAVLKAFDGNFNYDNVFIATGNNFPDALAGTALASKTSSPIILAESSMYANTANYLASKVNLNTKILALGGETIISNSIVISAIDAKANISVTKNYSLPGTYSDGAINGSVIISEAGVNLKNTTISGDLLIASTVREGNVDLDNVTVTGKIIINGGGLNSVKFHNMHSKLVELDKATGESVRLAIDSTTSIDTILISSRGIVDVAANSKVTSVIADSDVTITGTGVIESITLASSGLNLNLQITSVGTIFVTAAAVGCKIDISSVTTVTNLNANAAVTVSGTGKITNANIGANGTTISITPGVTSVTAGVSVLVNGVTKNSTNSPVIPSVPEIPTVVSAIAVTGDANATSVVVNETLKMNAAVTPATATNQTIAWTVTTLLGGTATINATTGLLAATGIGTVTVIATNASSGITGTMIITITQSVAELALQATAQASVLAYENAPITTLAEVAIAEGLKSAADTAIAAVGDPIAKAGFELRVTNRTITISAEKTALQETAILVTANSAVLAYENAAITTLAEVATAEGLKSAADTAVVAVGNVLAKMIFELRITNRTIAISAAKATLEEAALLATADTAVSAYENAPITILAEVATAEGLKPAADTAIAAVGNAVAKMIFELRVTNRVTEILAAKTILLKEAALQATAETAILAYENATITTLVEVATAEGLKSAADTAIAAVGNATVKTGFELRVTNRAAAILAAKTTILEEAALQATAEAAVLAYENATITTLAEVATAEGLKSAADTAVAAVGNVMIKTGFELRITNKAAAILAAKTTLLEIAALQATAETAVLAYENATITTLVELATAEGLKSAADTAVAAVVDTTVKLALELRITNRAAAIATAKTALQLAAAIEAINTAPDATAMSLAITTHAVTLGLNLTDYNALSAESMLIVQTAMIAPIFTTSAQVKATFNTEVLKQKALVALNTASAATMGSVITTNSSALGLTSTTLADYNTLSVASKDIVHAALVGKAFANSTAVNTAFATAVSVLVINDLAPSTPPLTSSTIMESFITRYMPILGLEAIPYATYITPEAINPNTVSFKYHVNTVLMSTALTSTADVKAAFTAAVTAEAVHTIDIQLLNFIDRDLRNFAVILGLDFTDYDALLNKVPVQTRMVAQPFTTTAEVKASFDLFVAQQKSLESMPLLDAFNTAPDAATMENIIATYQTLFNATDYNTYNNIIGTVAKTAVQTAMLAPTFLTNKDIQIAFAIAMMNNTNSSYSGPVFSRNVVLFGLATSTVNNEFASLLYAAQSPITNAVYAAKPIVDQTQIVVVALNSTITESYIGTLLALNSGLLGLDLTAYNALTPAAKTIVHNALIAATLTNATDVQTAFNSAIAASSAIPAVGEATSMHGANEITFTLTTGTFDPTAGILASNWIIGGEFGLMDLESISTVVLSNGNKTATLTVTGTVYAGGDYYTIAPTQAAFSLGFTAPAEVLVIVAP